MAYRVSQVSAPEFKYHTNAFFYMWRTLLIKTAQIALTEGRQSEFNIFICLFVFFLRMDDFFASSKEEAPDNIPMMFITMPSAKDPEAKIRHPGTNTRYFFYCYKQQ